MLMSAKLALASSLALDPAARVSAGEAKELDRGRFAQIDSMLSAAVRAGDVPGVVALAANDNGVVYESAFGLRRLPDGPAMTPATIFRIASMVKLITSVAAMQLVEQQRLSLDDPVPDIDPAVGSPQVLQGFDAAGQPLLRPARRSITLRQLLTHTAGFAYQLWDTKTVQYFKAINRLPSAVRTKAPHSPLMFDPGEHWQYGPNINWVGHIVESTTGEQLDAYFHKYIFDPLGMKDTEFMLSPQQQAREASVHRRQQDGSLAALPTETQRTALSFSGGGGIYSTGADYLTLIRALLLGGSISGARILRPETVALMGQNQIGNIDVGVLRSNNPALSNDVDLFPNSNFKWGFGHMINMQAVPGGRSAGSLSWGGLFNTYYWIDPNKHVAAVFMTQVLPFADHAALRTYQQFERGIYRALKAS
jgi:CubicO group peptidase (beta-lactamase class C family)